MENSKDNICSGNCDCCGSYCETPFQPGDATVTLTLDDDTEIECAILTIFPAGGKEYIALLPLDENGQNTDGEVYLYRYEKGADGQPSLDNITDDEEYEAAADAFDELLDKAEYDEVVDGEDL